MVSHKSQMVWNVDFFNVNLARLLNKQSIYQWLETPWRSCVTAMETAPTSDRCVPCGQLGHLRQVPSWSTYSPILPEHRWMPFFLLRRLLFAVVLGICQRTTELTCFWVSLNLSKSVWNLSSTQIWHSRSSIKLKSVAVLKLHTE